MKRSLSVGVGLVVLLGTAVVGCHVELTRAYEDQSLQLFDSTLEVETTEVKYLEARRQLRALDAVQQAADQFTQDVGRSSGGLVSAYRLEDAPATRVERFLFGCACDRRRPSALETRVVTDD